MKRLTLLLPVMFFLAESGAEEATDMLVVSSVGLPAKIEQFVIPGARVEARPIDDKRSPIVVRIIDVYPHGDALRYDLEFYGLEPGNYDLRDYFQREDGTEMDKVPPIPVKVVAVLPTEEVLPHDREPERVGRFGGYKLMLAAVGTVWLLGLWGLIKAGRKRGEGPGDDLEKVQTFADRLRPLVKRAQSGDLDDDEMARLERILLGFWRDKLDLGEEDASTAVTKMRNHEEAGKLLRVIERWLHDPRGRDEEVDVAALLETYAKDVAP